MMPTDLIARLRILLGDARTDPEVREGVLTPGQLWTDGELEGFLLTALSVWNTWAPVTDHNTDDLGPEGRRHLLWGAAAIATQVANLYPEEIVAHCPYQFDIDALQAWVDAKGNYLERIGASAQTKWQQARLAKAS